MKKALTIIVALALVQTLAVAQTKVQDRFMGLSMGQQYNNIFNCPELMDVVGDRYGWTPLKNVPLRSLQVFGVSFGGRYWDNMEYYFSPSGVFYKFRVYSSYDRAKDAEPRYSSLMGDLDLKYSGKPGITREEDDQFNPKRGDREKSVTYRDGRGMVCRLALEYIQSTNMEMNCYLMLYYINTNLEKEAKTEFVNEL